MIFSVLSCRNEKRSENESKPQQGELNSSDENNTLTEKEKADGWVLLFDGNTTEGWHLFNNAGAKPVWEAKEGTLACEPINGTGAHGDLVTDKEYGNYELTFDWKTTENGNSGVFINVRESPDYIKTYHTGPEYQLLDPSHVDQAVLNKRSGCMYGFAPQLNATKTRPAGEWNNARIKQVDGKVEFYLNGNLTAKADFSSPEWKEMVAASGFKDFPDFGMGTSGHIALQEWTSNIWFRNIKIREL
jgi:hypothetical protein